MEILLLVIQVRNFRINGNNRFRKLEEIGERVDKLVVTDGYITASTGLEPAVTIPAKQNRRTRCMVEYVSFNYGLQRSTEQGTSGTVVTNHIIRKIHFRTPFQVLYTETFFCMDSLIQRIHESNLEILGTMQGFLIMWSNRSNFILFIQHFHGL